MKKVFALILAAAMMLALVACGSDADKVAAYVAENGQEISDGIEAGLAGSPMTGEVTVKADGCDIVISINIQQLENVDDATKAQMQASADASAAGLSSVMSGARSELPELEGMVYQICDKNGEVLASVRLD